MPGGVQGPACDDITDDEDVTSVVSEGPFYTGTMVRIQVGADTPPCPPCTSSYLPRGRSGPGDEHMTAKVLLHRHHHGPHTGADFYDVSTTLDHPAVRRLAGPRQLSGIRRLRPRHAVSLPCQTSTGGKVLLLLTPLTCPSAALPSLCRWCCRRPRSRARTSTWSVPAPADRTWCPSR